MLVAPGGIEPLTSTQFLMDQFRRLISGTGANLIMNKKCLKCGEEKLLEEFYAKKDRPSRDSWCKLCLCAYQMKRWKDRKIKAIEYKGGKCMNCSTVYPPEVYDFHHRDPSTKEYNWTKLRLKSWKNITIELDKCILLCANCHRIAHIKLLV